MISRQIKCDHQIMITVVYHPFKVIQEHIMPEITILRQIGAQIAPGVPPVDYIENLKMTGNVGRGPI